MELQANELRLGNYIHRYDFGDLSLRNEQILEIGTKLVCTGPIKVICELKDVKPIPITEEWLVKMGFENDYDSTWIIDIGNDALLWYDLKRKTIAVGVPYEASGNEVKRPFLHQLQNLFHSLTGEELTIK